MIPSLTHAITTFAQGQEARAAFTAALKEAVATPAAITTPEEIARLETLQAQAQASTAALQNLLRGAWDAAITAKGRSVPARQGLPGSTPFEHCWELLATQPLDSLPQYQREAITTTLANAQIWQCKERLKEGQSPQAIADALAGAIATGTFTRSATYSVGDDTGDHLLSIATGRRLRLSMDNWAIALWRKENNAFTPPRPMPDGRVFLHPITLPSGRLLAADAVDVGGLREAVIHSHYRNGLSANYAWPRVIMTFAGLLEHGFFDTHVGSDGPGLVQGPDESLFAARPTNGFPEVAPMCHDYWGTNLVDRATLAEYMVVSGTTPAKANAAIDAWVQDRHHSEVIVSPGTWYALWDSDGTSVAKALAKAGIDAPEGTRFALLPYKPDLDRKQVFSL